jgi:hypothetical protein
MQSLVPTDADWSAGISGTDIEIGLKLFARRLKVNAWKAEYPSSQSIGVPERVARYTYAMWEWACSRMMSIVEKSSFRYGGPVEKMRR